ncbi:35008_t:CDS:2, partial [Gigaspora margarita]
SDDNHVNSAYSFLKSNQTTGCELCYELMTSQITAIGFITPLYSKIKQMSEIYCDAIYKTAKGRFELYGLICDIKGAGYPLAYLILDTTKISDEEPQNERRTRALSGFFDSIRCRGLYPDYFYTDKDFSEINAAKQIWSNADIQLCQYQKLKCCKKVQQVQYRPEDGTTEFDYIDLNFKPNLKDLENEICPQHLRQEVLDFIKMHFNQYFKFPVNASGQFLTPIEIRKNSVCEITKWNDGAFGLV